MSASSEQIKAAAFAVLIGALVLLVLAVGALGGQPRVVPPSAGDTPPALGAPIDGFDALFATGPFARLLATEHRDVFATDHFNKTKPAPKTRSVPLTYLGLLDGGSIAPTIYVRSDKETLRLAPGGVVVGDWRIAEISRESLVLTNAAAATNRLVFRQTLTLEVPIR